MSWPYRSIRSQSDLFTEMSKYQTGVSADGSPTFSIPLPPDEDGMVGRECKSPDCSLSYFKIRDGRDEGDEAGETTLRTCPYCGHHDACEEFYTAAQRDWIERLMHRDIEQTIVRQLDQSFGRMNRSQRGPLKITAKATVARLPSAAPYVEKKLKQATTCDHCGGEYAVYGISYFCPFCAGGTLGAHIRQSCEAARTLAKIADSTGDQYGQTVRDQLLGNAYEDAVTLFEGFLRRLHEYGLKNRRDAADVSRLVSKLRNSFQRLDDAEAIIQRDLGLDLFYGLEAADRERLSAVFCKRHVLTHNLGLGDERYRDQVRAWQKPGQEVPLSPDEAVWAIDAVERVLCSLQSHL